MARVCWGEHVGRGHETEVNILYHFSLFIDSGNLRTPGILNAFQGNGKGGEVYKGYVEEPCWMFVDEE